MHYGHKCKMLNYYRKEYDERLEGQLSGKEGKPWRVA